jgi:hypothetical protein
MKTLRPSLTALPALSNLELPLSNRLVVVAAPQAGGQLMLELAARLALYGRLLVLDGGNQFNAYPVARLIRRHTPDLTAALQNIRLARGFTCYQMAALLAECSHPQPQGVLHEGTGPILVLDLLSTFYDENVRLDEARRLLGTCIGHLQRLSRTAPVVVGARPTHKLNPERRPLFEMLMAAASQVWEAD